MKFVVPGALALALCTVAPAAAVTIDFDDRPGGVNASPLVYAEATFTSDSGQFFVGAAGVDDEICALTAAFNCEGALTVDFAGAVNNLSFLANGEESDTANLFVAVTTLTGTSNFTFSGFDGNSASFELIDLSGFIDITSILVTSDDPAGLAYDTFTFDADGPVIPEPASWSLMIAGFGLVGASLRRRAGHAATA